MSNKVAKLSLLSRTPIRDILLKNLVCLPSKKRNFTFVSGYILKDVTIGEGLVIEVGSVVVKDNQTDIINL